MTDWRGQPRGARIVLSEVQNAISQLQVQGIENPSVRAIRGIIERGSLDKRTQKASAISS